MSDADRVRVCFPLVALGRKPGDCFEVCYQVPADLMGADGARPCPFMPDELILPLNVGHAFSVLGFRTQTRPAIPLPAAPFLSLTGSVLTAGYLYRFARGALLEIVDGSPKVPPGADMCLKVRNDSEKELHFYAELWGFAA